MSLGTQGRENSEFLPALDAVRAAASVETAVFALKLAYRMDHVTFHVAKNMSARVEEPYIKTTYPAEWVKRYLVQGYVAIDPVVQQGFARRLPFHWSDLELTPEARELFLDAERYDVGTTGYTIPVVDREARRSILSVTSSRPELEWRAFIQRHGTELAEAGHAIHRKAMYELYGELHHFPHLSHREIECLSWTAQGKDAPTISMILHLSEHTVRAYLRSVRYKLDCSTLSQAVAKAMQLRIITPP
ncbi:LuxR family transcriptional regulator [Chelativorans sp. YIM 93263]|uniref:LuxR family transcriptional regulator n=1 Tax=Chelativorans sp. YIM 93263 TaxID=2906648 RepID=UPI002379D4BB|nr:LuxR family transcriptional regulator [Chelativorans sp. YIM 93263]